MWHRILALSLVWGCAEPAPNASAPDGTGSPSTGAPAETSERPSGGGQLPPPGDCAGTVSDELTCTTARAGQVLSTDVNDVFGTFSCGVPNGSSPQDGPDLVWEFACPVTGRVVFDFDGLDCDIDVYVLDDTCDPEFGGCIIGANDGATTPATVAFDCDGGSTYYIVIEGWGYGYAAAQGGCNPNDTQGHFTITVDTAASTACMEDCNDGEDNNADSLWDCDDPVCYGHPSCVGIEVCTNGVDDDGDFAVDCDDADCADHDLDTVPDGCDTCPGSDDRIDADADTVADDCDLCAGGSDLIHTDTDDLPDGCDNCPLVDNLTQEDIDVDGAGDVCDQCALFDDRIDADLDLAPDDCDNCLTVANPDQADTDLDTIGDLCDACPDANDFQNADEDTVPDSCDNCVTLANEDQSDADDDGSGDACDECAGDDDRLDADYDNVPDACDVCPDDADPDQADEDGDGLGDACDVCVPVDEVCGNGIDDDCDGETDEGCDEAEPDDTETPGGDAEDGSKGCGCDSGPGANGALTLLAACAAVALRRRR